MGGWVCGCVCVCLKQVYNKLHRHWHCWKHLCLWQLNNFSTTLFIYIYLTFPRKVECWLANICILVTNGWLSVHIQLFFCKAKPTTIASLNKTNKQNKKHKKPKKQTMGNSRRLSTFISYCKRYLYSRQLHKMKIDI